VLLMEDALRALPPVDEEGLLVNAIVEYVEGDTDVQRVSQVCEKFAISERSLQRLTARRIGLGPKWLIQRRRLHEAAERLRGPEPPDLARVAADLGYSDQAHFTRDFRTVTGLTPGEFAGEPRA
jgi:AraC-like DNA-binding protein